MSTVWCDRLASYERWDDRVRQAILWLGLQGILPVDVADPVDVIERAKRAEPERMKLAAVLRAVHTIEGEGRWRAAELIKVAPNGETEHTVLGVPIELKAERSNALCDALMEVAGDRGAINPRMLGRWIERNS